MSSKSEKQINTQHELLLSKLQAMSEADFTIEALIPLFKMQGYQVDYHGGPGEGGKDFICRKGGDFGFEETCVVQVKKVKPSAAVGKTNSFAAIVSQLQQAAEKKVPSLSGIAQLPNHIYFITPFEIDIRALESRFEGVASLTPRGVRILDGRLVVHQLTTYLPDVVEKICGEAVVIKQRLLSNISNADLLSALEYTGEKKISDFYCDLDFGVGKVTTKALFAMEFSPKTVSYSVPESRWPAFKTMVGEIESLLSCFVLDPSVDNIEKKFSVARQRWLSPANQEIILRAINIYAEIKDGISLFLDGSAQVVLETLYEELSQELNKSFSQLKVDSKLSVQEVQRLNNIKRSNERIADDIGSWFSSERLEKSECERIGAILAECKEHLEDIRAETSILKTAARVQLTELLKSIAKLERQHEQLTRLLIKRVDEPNYEMQISGSVLAESISQKKLWLSQGIESLSETSSSEYIREFFLACQALFKTIEHVLENKMLNEALGPRSRKELSLLDPSERISMPLKKVFATGIHCAVFGEAGAGKSTTLHQYADYAYKDESDDGLTLFLPLTRILTERIDSLDNKNTSIQKLEACLGTYLAFGRRYCATDVIEFIKQKRRVTFIFDGVDEVIKRAPWIVEAISSLEDSYPNCQIIVSSRASGAYVNDIKYLALTLLPFTDEQVSHFIDGWFIGEPTLGQAVKSHLLLASGLREIVRSPLLATILCVLAEHNVPLPNGELDMYRERLELLLGRYDIHKQTKRIDSRQSLLETVARKLAFYLQSRTSRAASPAILQESAIRLCGRGSSKSETQKIRRAVKELDDPCNILVPMTSDGDFGFGHLRYQEYLCARELCANRGIDLAPLLSSPSWKGVLVLFARMTDDVSHVITDIVTRSGANVTRYKDNLLAMIETRGKEERRHLSALLEDHARLDDWDHFTLEYDLDHE
jgi:hypothetical protein